MKEWQSQERGTAYFFRQVQNYTYGMWITFRYPGKVYGDESVQMLSSLYQLLISGGHIHDDVAKKIEDSPIDAIEVRSALTCEAKKGICSLCYGRNLATGKMVQRGEAVGVVAAQSIGEPGTQLTIPRWWYCRKYF